MGPLGTRCQKPLAPVLHAFGAACLALHTRVLAMLVGLLMCVACQSRNTEAVHDAAASSEALPTTSLQVPTRQLSRLAITQPGKETVTLSMSNGSWRTVTPLPFPANKPAVESIVAALAELEILRQVADSPTPTHRLTTDSAVVVKAWTKDGAMQQFSVGASVGEETYVQRVGEARVYSVRGRCRRIFDLSFEQLRDATITKLDVTKIERVTYRNRFGEMVLVAEPNDASRFVEASPGIRNFDSERASKNVAVLSELFAKSFVDAPLDQNATGLFSPDTARVLVSIRGGSVDLIVYVGAPTKNGRLHLRTSDSDQIYLVSAHLVSSLVPQQKHFERSDDEMHELRAQDQAREPSAKTEEPTHVAEHKHGATLPTEVPPELMSELRDLARQQRD